MIDLIARIESADGPSRELDAEIFIAACHPTWRIQTECKLFPEQVQTGRIQEPDGCGWRNAPAYTASIDAALTLVPEEFRLGVLMELEDGTWAAKLFNRGKPGGLPLRAGATPALALAAAALKARGV